MFPKDKVSILECSLIMKVDFQIPEVEWEY
jgi:hypothetical protein